MIDTIIEIWAQYHTLFIKGTLMTIYIAFVGTLVGGLIGLIVGLVRTIPLPTKKNFRYFLQKTINLILRAYIDFFRATPMIVQAMVFYYGIAETFNIQMDIVVAALIIVSINTGAYMSEIVRGGIISIDKGQFEAGKTIGMSHHKVMTYIIFPQVIRNILPATSNEFIVNIKDTSVLSVIGVSELFYSSKTIAGSSFKIFATYAIACIIYLIMTLLITVILRKLENYLEGPENYELIVHSNPVSASKEV